MQADSEGRYDEQHGNRRRGDDLRNYLAINLDILVQRGAGAPDGSLRSVAPPDFSVDADRDHDQRSASQIE